MLAERGGHSPKGRQSVTVSHHYDNAPRKNVHKNLAALAARPAESRSTRSLARVQGLLGTGEPAFKTSPSQNLSIPPLKGPSRAIKGSFFEIAVRKREPGVLSIPNEQIIDAQPAPACFERAKRIFRAKNRFESLMFRPDVPAIIRVVPKMSSAIALIGGHGLVALHVPKVGCVTKLPIAVDIHA